MMRATYERATDIFQRALDLNEDERWGYIESACNGDAELLSIVRNLWRSDAEDSFLVHPADITRPYSRDHVADTAQLMSIGDYRIIRVIASGSMGTVFLAEQASPRRHVAIKLLAIDHSATSSLLAEASLLGRLQHPGIARVYEAGTAKSVYEDGTTSQATFIAMEHIEGKTLSEFAHDKDFTRTEIAELLLKITVAIEHAHRRGVIHRDLKPSNILVDPTGTPHIIDFGVGLVRGEITGTGGAHIAGTAAYMAPEQMVGQAEQVDTRADVFSIGVIGYELLTGMKPYKPTRSISEALLDRIKLSGQEIGRTLRQSAGRELASVISRALVADKEQRHPSASALANDLRCVIQGRPIDSADASLFWLLWMYARRHRIAASLLCGAFLLCVATTIALGVSLSQAHREASRADAAAAQMRAQALNAQRIADFLKTAFLGVDPEERGVAVTLFDAIDYATARIHRDLADVPGVEADVRSAIGFVYRRQGRLADAFEQTRIAHRLYVDLYGTSDNRTMGAAEELAYLTWIYEGDADAARQAFDQLIRQTQGMVSADAPLDGWIHIKAGVIALAVDDLLAAEQHFVEAEPLLVEAYGDVYAARSLRLRALVRLFAGKPDEAEEMARAAFNLCYGAAEQEYVAARCLVTLGEVLVAQGRSEEALITLDHAASILTRLTGDTGPDFARLSLVAARAEHERGNTGDAVHHLQRATHALEPTVSPSHPELAEARAYLLAYKAQGDSERRERLTEVHVLLDGSHGPDHRLSIAALHAALEHAENMNDDHTARRLRITIAALERRREVRVGAELHYAHPSLSF